MAAGAHEGFLNVRFAHAQLGHAAGKLGLFFQADGIGAHEEIVAAAANAAIFILAPGIDHEDESKIHTICISKL